MYFVRKKYSEHKKKQKNRIHENSNVMTRQYWLHKHEVSASFSILAIVRLTRVQQSVR